MIEHVDPFVGSSATRLPPPVGLAATWWWPKPQVGNTHPGATYPFGMVSACAYSGAYPTGYGLYELNTEGVPPRLHDEHVASGFTHFQQSGTGAIRKYYNYFRVTPMLEPLDALGTTWLVTDEEAEPGYYACTLGGRPSTGSGNGGGSGSGGGPGQGVRCELTVGPKSAVHRYTFGAHADARVVIDFSMGGLTIPYGATVPLRAHLETISPSVAEAEIVVEGVPLATHLEVDGGDWRQLLWYDRRLMQGGTRMDFDRIRPTTLRPFGLMWRGRSEPGQVVELRFGFSLRGRDQARANLRHDAVARDRVEVRRPEVHEDPTLPVSGPDAFDSRRADTGARWREHLGRIRVETPSAERRSIFYTALYHALIKPCFAADESPFWPSNGSFAFDVCTMWDVYRTQLPLLTALFPARAAELANALITIAEEEGNLPIGYRMAKGVDRFSRQGSALAQTFLADLCALGVPGVDWDWALVHMDLDLRRGYGEEFLLRGLVHPVTHTLDLAFGYHCTAKVARHVGDQALATQLEGLATRWVNAFDPGTGLLVDSSFYEGGRWNYSFRVLHDMQARVDLAGGEQAYLALLDSFFGFGAEPVTQVGERPQVSELAAGYALNRFEGLNNEPDMEAPWAYHYLGRPDRTAEVVHGVVENMFGLGRGGLPGNDDSGGLSSWYVWASLGLFPVAGQSLYMINAPSFAWSRVQLGREQLEITTSGFVEPSADGAPQYVQSVTFNDQAWTQSWISARDLHRGGTLRVDLGPRPSAWGTTSRPPSVTRRGAGHPAPSAAPVPLTNAG
ncbi:Putative alpha-1,2-mannosidase [Microlunatus sagamiharensis]|uniref:Putative alpha-1,2-mannosidase n=1 Tax=Microlunatus sagamiharensis TaxID=546874 RepID=A0A1H2MK83_9ACTN|nr:glycoside hydrolase domain-containing protein [Microlunatus sagamiharensis]SDU92906.1 Putative alpha-1,2-mannosidase [Microlunatus sagamiharensis]